MIILIKVYSMIIIDCAEEKTILWLARFKSQLKNIMEFEFEA